GGADARAAGGGGGRAGGGGAGGGARAPAPAPPPAPRTRHEQARRGAVVGPPAAVLLDPSAELGEGHQHDPLRLPRAVELGEEPGDGVGQLLEELLVLLELVGVGVEPAVGDVEQPGTE